MSDQVGAQGTQRAKLVDLVLLSGISRQVLHAVRYREKGQPWDVDHSNWRDKVSCVLVCYTVCLCAIQCVRILYNVCVYYSVCACTVCVHDMCVYDA